MSLLSCTISLSLLGCVAACSTPLEGFECTIDAECLSSRQTGGRCEDTRHCSFDDAECPSGRRYGEAAGELTATCLGEDPIPVSTIRRRLLVDVAGLNPGLLDVPVHVRIPGDIVIANNVPLVTHMRFTVDGLEVPFELEKTPPSPPGDVFLWLRLPRLGSEVFLEYGEDVVATTPQSVWNELYEGVYHLDDAPLETALDSTKHARTGSPLGPIEFEKGQWGSGTRGCWQLGDVFDFTERAPFSVSMWAQVQEPESTGFPRLISNLDYSLGRNGYSLELANDGRVVVIRSVLETDVGSFISERLPLGEFVHIAASYDGSELKIYLNGIEQETQVDEMPLPSTPSTLQIGCETGGLDFPGVLDEVRISRVARPPDWFRAHFVLGTEPARIALGEPE